MPTPKIKTSKSKRNQRRSHDGLSRPPMSRDPKTGEVFRPHCVGPDGYYKGRLVDAKLARKSRDVSDFTEADLD